MSCTFPAPPGTPATTRSISPCVSSASGSISGGMAPEPAGIRFGGARTTWDSLRGPAAGRNPVRRDRHLVRLAARRRGELGHGGGGEQGPHVRVHAAAPHPLDE